jgi:uncharacterized protein YggE
LKVLAVVAGLSVLLFAGFAATEGKRPSRTVRVVGTSEVKVVPDRVVISLGVEKQNNNASVAKQLADSAARRLLDVLHRNGVGEKDIQTTFLSLQPLYDYDHGIKISDFIADQTWTVTIRDLARLDKILQAIIEAGGNRIDSIQYETSDPRKYRDQARDLAIKAAREKAQALAGALGQSTGKAVAIEEVPQFSDQYSGLASNATFEPRTAPAKSGPATATGERTISASVTVTFDLN